MKKTIRKFEKDDRDLYIELSHKMFLTPAVLHTIPVEYMHHTFDVIMNNSPYAEGYILEADGQPAGYALLSYTYSNEVGGEVLLLEEIYIEQAYRGCGFGKEFLSFLDTKLQGNIKRIRLEVTKSNEGAMKLYEKSGFKFIEYNQMVKDL